MLRQVLRRTLIFSPPAAPRTSAESIFWRSLVGVWFASNYGMTAKALFSLDIRYHTPNFTPTRFTRFAALQRLQRLQRSPRVAPIPHEPPTPPFVASEAEGAQARWCRS